MRPYLRRRLAELTGGHLNVAAHDRRRARAAARPRPARASTAAGRCRSWLTASSPSRSRVESSGYFEPVAAMPGFPSVLLRTLRELRGAGVDAAAFVARRSPRGPTRRGKLTALAALYADHERRRAGFFSSEDGLAVADATGARRRPAARVRRVGAVGAALVRARRVERERRGHGAAAAGPRRGRASDSAVRRLGGGARRRAGDARRAARIARGPS